MNTGFPFSQYLDKSEMEKSSDIIANDSSHISKSHKESELSNIIDDVRATPILSEKGENSGSFKVQLNETKEDLLSRAEGQYMEHMNTAGSELLVDPNKTFDNFIVGPSNQLVVATAEAVGDAPGKEGKFPCLYIYGSSGLGKTHLLHAVAHRINNKFSDLAICLITARQFMKEMVNSVRNKNLSEFQRKYAEVIDVLMIDDIHELKNKEGTQNEFFHIFNELYNRGKQLIFTSDKPPKEIDGIEERIKTRLQWGLVLDIQKPDFETRMAILKNKAYSLDLFLNDDAFALMAGNITSSIRELEGSLIKLSAFADLMKTEIDTEMVKNLLNFTQQKEHSSIKIDTIATTVSSFFNIPLTDIRSKARNKDLTYARHISMYLSKKMTNSTLKEIAKFYGGRNHSSVIHGITKIESDLKNNSRLAADLTKIKEKFLH